MTSISARTAARAADTRRQGQLLQEGRSDGTATEGNEMRPVTRPVTRGRGGHRTTESAHLRRRGFYSGGFARFGVRAALPSPVTTEGLAHPGCGFSRRGIRPLTDGGGSSPPRRRRQQKRQGSEPARLETEEREVLPAAENRTAPGTGPGDGERLAR